jgi:putative addiction module killer protein
MVDVRMTEVFRSWLRNLHDDEARVRILARINRLSRGNPGDAQPVGDGVVEMRIHYGPGCRVYFRPKGSLVLLLLCGGDKSSQQRDIRRAKALAEDWTDGD